jgi:hypothetical protein
VEEIIKLRTALAVTSNSSETLVLTKSTRHRIPENVILDSHRRENLKSYKKLKIVRGI